MPRLPHGAVLYNGPSLLDGSPIVAIAASIRRPSANAKTGPMIQVYILRSDMHPVNAMKDNLDRAICGDCKGRMSADKWCYAVYTKGLLQIWANFKAGKYPVVDIHAESTHQLFKNRAIRIGAYGDPAAVPAGVWAMVKEHSANATGYTHAWRSHPELKPYCMASCDNEKDFRDAAVQNWSTFRAKRPSDCNTPAEITCPAESKGRLCIQCGICDGATKRQRHVTITVHGKMAHKF